MALPPDAFWSGRPEDQNTGAHAWLGLVLIVIVFLIASRWDDWRDAHQRGARLTAYRCRHHWRKADVPRLRKLGVPIERIQRIIDDNKRLGRGVVQSYQSLDEVVTRAAGQFTVLVTPETKPQARLATLKQTPVWRYVVEALYRGEHLAAKEERKKSASSHAEQVVASCLGISDSQVHKICGGVRNERKRENRSADGEFLLRISEFEVWKRDGDLQTS